MNPESFRGTPTSSGADLGASFEAMNSATSGGDLGEAFAAQNTVLPEQRLPFLRAERQRSRRHRWIWIGSAGLLLLAALLFGLHARSSHAKPAANGGTQQTGSAAGGGKAASGRGGAAQGPAAITVGQAKTGDINVYVDALGTVTPTYTVTIYSQITGRVMAVNYHEGEIVRKGQSLVEIDPRPYQATLTQAEGTLVHDQGLLAEARIDLKRYQDAFARNAIARQQLEDQVQVVKQYEGTVTSDEGAVDYDKVQLSYCHIVAPISGRVGLRLVDPGNTVFSGTGSTLVVVTQVQPITVVFNVSEDDLPQVQAQLKTRRKLEVDAFDRSNTNQIEGGTLGALDNQVDTATGTIKFRANFLNRGLQLFPNQFVNARLLVKTLRSSTLIPTAAVQHNGTSAFVYVVKPDKTVGVQSIQTQTSNDQVTAVTGVASGTTLATSGFDRLENGVPVLVHGQSQGNTQGHGSNSGTGGNTGGNTAP